MEFKHTPEPLRPLVKSERPAEVEPHFRDIREARQRLEKALTEPPEWMAEIGAHTDSSFRLSPESGG